jgi:1-phosphofructokinase family hexose kinase
MVNRIITVGLAPAWDVCYRGDVGWGRHAVVEARAARPGGKALNVSRALGWMGHPSIAAGLWGAEDFDEMRSVLRGTGVDVRMTLVAGRTRQNDTIVDTRRGREMHLRCRSELASERALRRLKGDLGRLVRAGDLCVFAGAMPDRELAEATIDVVRVCSRRGARIAIDTHGVALRELVQEVRPWLISPNLEELAELLGHPIRNGVASLARAGGRLLDRVENVLISRGEKGAVLVTPDGAWAGQAVKMGKVTETVGCGDCLLAGFLASHRWGLSPFMSALATALKAATAHACGWTHQMTWHAARRRVEVAVDKL